MNIGLLILIVIGGAAGGLSTLYIAVSLFGTLGEYSRAVTPQVRQAGNRLSGLTETTCASLLA